MQSGMFFPHIFGQNYYYYITHLCAPNYCTALRSGDLMTSRTFYYSSVFKGMQLDLYSSDYKSRLSLLNMLPLMMVFELLDVMFFVNSFKNPNPAFSISCFVHFNSHSTRSGTHHKLQYNSNLKTDHNGSILHVFLVFGMLFHVLTWTWPL